MSEVRDGEVHIDEEDATGGSKEGVVRWVLLFSMLAAIVILSIIWITGALTQGDDEEEAVYSEIETTDGSPLNDPLLADEDNDATEIGDDAQVEDGLPVIEND